MRTNDFIKELNLSANAFTSAGAQDLATALAENRTLQTLKLKNNAIGDAGITSIFASVLDNPASVLSCVDCRCVILRVCVLFRRGSVFFNEVLLVTPHAALLA
jgi:hypothetical protein